MCVISVNKIRPPCGIAAISNPTVCDVCVFKRTVTVETILFAVLSFPVCPLARLNLASISSLSHVYLFTFK